MLTPQAQIDRAHQTLKALFPTTRVVLLHPHSRYRALLLTELLRQTARPVFYHALNEADRNLANFLGGWHRQLAQQHPTFGRHLDLLPPSVYADYTTHLDVIVPRFAREIAELSDQPFWLILDEYDHSDLADDIQRFIERLSDHLPEHCQLLISSRSLPRLPWIALMAEKRATMLCDGSTISKNFYRASAHEQALEQTSLEALALGPAHVLSDGEPIENWEGLLPRLLLFFVLDRPTVTRAEICQTFWQDMPPDQAVNVFHVTKRRLHKALHLDVLVHENHAYHLAPAVNLYYDGLEMVEQLMRGRDPHEPERQQAWHAVTQLYRGPFLMGHNDPWVLRLRQAYRAGYLEALVNLAEDWLSRDRAEFAIRFYRQALDVDPSRQDIHRQLLHIYAHLGRRSDVVAHYQNLQQVLHQLGREMDSATERLYREIMV